MVGARDRRSIPRGRVGREGSLLDRHGIAKVGATDSTKLHTVNRWQIGAEALPGIAGVFTDPNGTGGAAKGEDSTILGHFETVAIDEMVGVLILDRFTTSPPILLRNRIWIV